MEGAALSSSKVSGTGEEGVHLSRELKARHLAMLAIGGSIGTGLFLGAGQAIAAAGPGGALLAYLLTGGMVYFLMTSLAELAAKFPVSGSFCAYGVKFVEPSFGFALGWNYWINWAITVALEIVSVILLLGYWFPNWKVLLGLLALFGLIALNGLSVKGFGEVEYWFSWVKLLTLASFLVLAVLQLLLSIGMEGWSYTFENWSFGEAPFVGGLGGLLQAVMLAAFGFQGTEMVGIAAGESENPGKTLPIAISNIFWRILILYCGSMFVMGTFFPYNAPELLVSELEEGAKSPLTMFFSGILGEYAGGFINFVILTAVLSSANSGLYAASRMLYALSREGMAPAVFSRTWGKGVPRAAVLGTALVASLCFFACCGRIGTLYVILLNASASAGLIAWLGIAISHYRFRKGWTQQGKSLEALPYRASCFPMGPILSVGLCLGLTIGLGLECLLSLESEDRSTRLLKLLSIYSMFFLFFLTWWKHKRRTGSKMVPYREMDF